MRLSRLLAAMVVLQVLTLVSLWTGGQWVQPARAEPFDPAARQIQNIEELKSLNAKMDKLIGILESGKLQVVVVKADEDRKDGAK